MEEGEIHELTVEVLQDYIKFSVADISATVCTEDLFSEFYLGITACEGVVHLYELEIEEPDN